MYKRQSICGPNIITPTNNSDFATNYTWSIDQNGSSNNLLAVEPDFTIPENLSNDSIVYTIELIATSSQGCQDTTQQITTVYPRPQADITPILLDSCGPFTIEFINNSLANNNEPLNSMQFWWIVQGDTLQQTQDFTYTFQNDSFNIETYNVQLIVETQHGCQDIFDTTVTVYPDPIAQINALGSLVDCAPLIIDNNLIQAQNYSINNDSYIWTFTDPNGNVLATSNTIDPPTDTIVNDQDTVIVTLQAISVSYTHLTLPTICSV